MHNGDFIKVARLENIGILVEDKSVLGGYYLAKNVPVSYRIVDNRVKNKKRLNAPIYLDVYPSLLCNFRCSFCYIKLLGMDLADPAQMLDKTISDTVKMCVNYGISVINILGGEPLHPINRKTTFRLIEEAYKNGIDTDITTNGYFLDSDVVKFLNEHSTKLNISLQSLHSETSMKIIGVDPSMRLRNSIFNIVDGKISYNLTTAIMKTNYEELDELVDFVNCLKTCDSWIWRCVTVFGDFNKSTIYSVGEFFDVYKRYKDRIAKNVYFDAPFTYKYLGVKPLETALDSVLTACCNPGESKAEVMPNGTVYSCILFHSDKNQIIGSVSSGVDFTKEYGYKSQKCSISKCNYIKNCTGCRAYAILNNKSVDDRCEQRI